MNAPLEIVALNKELHYRKKKQQQKKTKQNKTKKTCASYLVKGSKHLKTIKALRLWRRAFISFSVFGTSLLIYYFCNKSGNVFCVNPIQTGDDFCTLITISILKQTVSNLVASCKNYLATI